VTAAAGAAATGSVPARQRRDERTIDDDEHLAAYNEFLARINAPHPRHPPRPGRPA
jgi:hypothetical protein